jgi:uncharacterized membrane protein
MHHDGAHIMESLGVKLPEDYRNFMEHYGSKLAEDPVRQTSWIGGLGNSFFVIGNTQAFRSSIQAFSKDALIIGYSGTKLIKEINEEIDVFVMLNTHDGHLHLVDSLGMTESLGLTFWEWTKHRLNEALLKEKYKSIFFAVAFDHKDRAAEIRNDLMELQRKHWIDLEDAVVAVRESSGKLKLRHMNVISAKGAFGGSLTGLLVGSLFLHPLLGAAVGAATEMVSAVFADLSLDESFVRDLALALEPGTSALFLLVKHVNAEKIGEEMQGMGGKVLMTSLTEEQEMALQRIMDASKEEVIKTPVG